MRELHEQYKRIDRIDAGLKEVRKEMNQEDQRYALMAAAAAAAYAQKKARDEARRAMIISTALNQNMSSLDPKTQEDLQRLLQAEARRVRQENFEWQAGWWALGILAAGFVLFFLILAGPRSSDSYQSASSATQTPSHVVPRATPQATPYVSEYVARLLNSTPQATPTMTAETSPVEVRRATLVHRHHRVNER
jgi:hypothetical protein